ncbi:hypothetical protein [Ktedonosporobacter rubrisoli]|nr:hypothetical protein [Ktedonosporobacter rubrisoli]
MRKEAITHPAFEPTTNAYTYAVVDSVQAVAEKMQWVTQISIEQFALVTITLYFEQEGRSSSARQTQARQSACYYLDNLRPLVRKTDLVFLSGWTFYFILLGANLQGGNIVQERLWDALMWRVHNSRTPGILRPRSMQIGHSAYPVPQQDAQECIMAANEASLSFTTRPEKASRKPLKYTNEPTSLPAKDAELSEMARKLGIPYLSLLPSRPPAKVQQLVSPQLAQELHCYPLGRERDILTVAIANPQDRRALDRLQQETGLHIFPVLASPRELQTALERLV